jgi:hypothetical protein
MLPKGYLLNLPENLKGEGHVPPPFLVPVGNRVLQGFNLWPKQNPAASGGEVEEGKFGRGGGVGRLPGPKPTSNGKVTPRYEIDFYTVCAVVRSAAVVVYLLIDVLYSNRVVSLSIPDSSE